MFLTLDFPLYFWEPEDPRFVFVSNFDWYASQVRALVLCQRRMEMMPKPEPAQMY